MAQFNYGINCYDQNKAQKLYKFIKGLNMVQDGLDVEDTRVSVISNPQLIKEIEKYASLIEGEVLVEVWSTDLEYDEAESKNKIEIFEYEGKKKREKSADLIKLSNFKTYSGVKDSVDNFKQWLINSAPLGLEIISEWKPEFEYGSYGIEFRCEDPRFDKLSNKEWMSKGVVTEKLKG